MSESVFPVFSDLITRKFVDKMLISVSVAMQKLHLQDMTIEQYEDYVTGHLIYRLEAYVYGKEHIEGYVTYPKTWVDAVKQRFFPKWLLRKFPANLESSPVRIIKMCPHINQKSDKPHLEWLDYGTPRRRRVK